MYYIRKRCEAESAIIIISVRKVMMSPLVSFMGVIFFFFFVVGLGGLFLTTSALCGNGSFHCLNGDYFGYPFITNSGFLPNSSDIGDDSFGNITNCGYPALLIDCISYGRPSVKISNNSYYILSNDPERRSLRIVEVDVADEDCPRPMHNFTLPTTSPFSNPYEINQHNITYSYNCTVNGNDMNLPCLNTYNNTTPGLRSFVNVSYPNGFNWYANCQKRVDVPLIAYINTSYDVALKTGFDLVWSTPAECKACENSGGKCWYNQTVRHACRCQNGTDAILFDQVCPVPVQTISQGVPTQLKIILGVCSGAGGLLLVILFIFRRKLFLSHWKSKIMSPTNIEAFLESCGCPGLQRYRYSEIKRMTNTFKEKLGQGGFGSVFKGKLSDGRLVAVKVLNESKGNGEDFINEVATIGGTNHVNVVSLQGFCSNGNKRALVYEFMPNGSLEKFIYNRENTSIANPPLGPEKLYQIALGIARGLEYLHRGCKNRILHFDIKPHNILLDQDFCPKIADFGLAKLYQTRESIVSMHVARGTMGYIAPEVVCINFGGVSHKSDVYSYGMMILEMIGGRKNIDTTVENISEIYFPQWIYNHFIHNIDDMDGHNEIFKEETIRKMIVVALHSIQTQPANRPSISKVVEMLEGNVDELQMPPNPFQDPPRFSP